MPTTPPMMDAASLRLWEKGCPQKETRHHAQQRGSIRQCRGLQYLLRGHLHNCGVADLRLSRTIN